MLPDHDAAVTIIVVAVPATVPASVMFTELGSRPIIAITVVIAVAANAPAEFGLAEASARNAGFQELVPCILADADLVPLAEEREMAIDPKDNIAG